MVVDIPTGATQSLDIEMSSVLSIVAKVPSGIQHIAATGTIDPDEVSRLDANLIDGNSGTICYNNRKRGSKDRSLPAIDLGTDQAVGAVRIDWYSEKFVAQDFKIQASSDGVAWTDVAANLSGVGRTGSHHDIIVSGTFRYWRLFCVQGTNSSWVILKEMCAFAAGGTKTRGWADLVDADITSDEFGNLEITNNYPTNIEFSIRFH